jgi:hypothetical protein
MMDQLTNSQPVPAVTGRPSSSNATSTFEMLERLVDQAAVFNAVILAEQNPAPTRNRFFGIPVSQRLHPFNAEMKVTGSCVKASNEIGEAMGTITQKWALVPDNYVAAPRRHPHEVPFDPATSQRFAMEQVRVNFGNGNDGFIGFGTGRTFPPARGRQEKLAVAGVGDILQGFGKFHRRAGNFIICGDLIPGHGFEGNILIRVVDSYGELRTKTRLTPIQPMAVSIPETTFLMLRSQKKGPGERSSFSYAANGHIRGINVPLELKQLSTTFAFSGTDGVMSDISIGEVMGKEVGFTATDPDNPGPGNGSSEAPFSFQGVSRYTFFDRRGPSVGSFTVNFIEGRTFLMKLPADPTQRALRFAFYGPIIFGTGCFKGVRGIFYGASGSVFEPPPGQHVIIHSYMARLDDAEGKYRVLTN